MLTNYKNDFIIVDRETLEVVENYEGYESYSDRAIAIISGQNCCRDFDKSRRGENEMMYFRTIVDEDTSVIQTESYTISKITDEKICFSNGYVISYDHDSDCCENNYADFSHLDTEAMSYEFHDALSFEAVEDAGFRFGDSRRKFFVPCYSEQNGYYSSDIDIYLNDEQVLNFNCEFVDG